MMYWVLNVVWVTVISVFFSGVLIPKILLISFRKKLFDVPDERKIHKLVVPRLGGIAFKPVIFFSIALLLGVNEALAHKEMSAAMGSDILPLSFVFCSVMMLYLVGMADDLIGIRYSAKFMAQFLCAVMLIAGGFWIDDLHGLLGVHALPALLGYPLTVLVVIFIINAINLIDGIDGLASGLSGIALFFYGVVFFSVGQYFYSLLAFASLGVLIPFFYYNVFGNPERGRKIFMGDTGSLTIGAILCVLSMKIFLSVPAGSSPYNTFVVAFSPLLIPCFDVVRVFVNRIRMKKNPFMPDKNHIHHKLLALGLPQRVAMVVILSVSLFLTMCNVFVSKYINVNILLLGNILLLSIINRFLSVRISLREKRVGTDPKESVEK